MTPSKIPTARRRVSFHQVVVWVPKGIDALWAVEVPLRVLGAWRAQELVMGLPRGSPLLAVLYNIYTKGQANQNSNSLTRAPALADYWLLSKTAGDTHSGLLRLDAAGKSVKMMTGDGPKSIQARPKPCGPSLATQQERYC